MSSALSMSMNGGRVPNGKDNNIYGLAWRLVGCDLGLRCDEQDIELQSSCYYFDICEKNKMDMIKKMTSVDSENHFEFNEVLQMKERILNAVKEKRTDAFFVKENHKKRRTLMSRRFLKLTTSKDFPDRNCGSFINCYNPSDCCSLSGCTNNGVCIFVLSPALSPASRRKWCLI
jgi:hypothetical protein